MVGEIAKPANLGENGGTAIDLQKRWVLTDPIRIETSDIDTD
jgi:hypothetical protein